MSDYGAAGYGSAYGGGYANDVETAFVQKPRRAATLPGMAACLFLPWLLFATIFWTQSFSIKYDNPSAAHMISLLGAILVGATAFQAFSIWRKGSDASWFGLLFFTSLVAYITGLSSGTYNYNHNMAPYYDVSNLNVYPSVDPSTMSGQQLMDAGRFVFTADSRLDISLSMGFRNLDTYCVAPVVSGNGSAAIYDFWAVGVNCCSGHVSDFHCGEFNNPKAQSGLRLMRDDLRSFFRLAVQQAEASFNIKTSHPIFLYYMQDPIAEINAYQDDGYKYFLVGVFAYGAFQLVCVVAGVFVFSKA